MTRFKEIFVPVDFSDVSSKAVGYGLSLALELEARLTLAHIIPFSPSLAYVYPVAGQEVGEAEVAEAKAKLEAMVGEEYREAVRARFVVEAGDVSDQLTELIGQHSPDLVVMGTYGLRGFQRWILGSVTERLLRTSGVPVLTVSRLDEEHRIGKPVPVPMKRMLYATDLSSESVNGTKGALALAHDFSAELVILHVVGQLGWAFGSEFIPLDVESRTVKARETAFEYLVNSVPKAAREDPRVRIEIHEGVPYEVILETAEKEEVDLIILNTQSRSGLDRALLGSTAERVVRGATVPVLSLRR